MNPFLKHLNKIEFAVTDACTGRCKHCSQGDHPICGEKMDPFLCAKVVEQVCKRYEIKTVMAFGGEPLLHLPAVESVMAQAKKSGVPVRQLITNGFVTSDSEKIQRIAERLFECGVNDLILSVDAFHQETIPIEVVKSFAEKAKNAKIPIRLQPAWLIAPSDENEFNQKTRALLGLFSELAIPVSEGNVIFPEGNARQYLAEYWKEGECPKNPYEEDPFDLRCLSVAANGDVLNGNLYREDILSIIKGYVP